MKGITISLAQHYHGGDAEYVGSVEEQRADPHLNKRIGTLELEEVGLGEPQSSRSHPGQAKEGEERGGVVEPVSDQRQQTQVPGEVLRRNYLGTA